MDDIAPKPVYLTFSAMIDQLAVQRFFAVIAGAMQEGFSEIHLLLQTTGGNVADGICLYNYFRSLPINISIYNGGTIASAGVAVFLGGDNKYVSPTGTFMIHRSHATFQGANADAVQARIPSLNMDDERMEAIFNQEIKLTPDQWALHKNADLWLNAKQAVETTVADEERLFDIPRGAKLFNVFG